MLYAIDNRRIWYGRARARRAARIRPYRLLACALLLIAVLMLIGIDQTTTFEQERLEAEARYSAALAENASLRRQLTEATGEDWQRETARKDYGYVYPGEVIYDPVYK